MVLCFQGLDKFGSRLQAEGLRARPAAADSSGFCYDGLEVYMV